MTQDDVFRKVGRGGAGNFFSKSTADTQEQVHLSPFSLPTTKAVPSRH